MDDRIAEPGDTARLADIFIELVKESALLNLENIQKVRSYAGVLLKEQRAGEAPVTQIDQKDASADESPRNSPVTRCAFCGRAENQVQRIIRGPGVCICDDCIYLCLQALLMPLD